MAGKPFSKTHYNRDDNAKIQVIDWLTDKGHEAWVNPDRYGIDVMSKTPEGKEMNYEVEVKHNWKGENFKYPGVHFSARKLKFAKDDGTVTFFMFNDDRSYALLVRGEDVLTAPIVMKDTIYTKDEEFIEVPVEKCTFIAMGEPSV
jgi:hypothetical protein